jgi:hypothetical protein
VVQYYSIRKQRQGGAARGRAPFGGNMDEETKSCLRDNLEDYLFQKCLVDPISNYPREQDHFIKYAPPYEVKAWIDWNNNMKECMKNKFASNRENFHRWFGEVPMYIELYHLMRDPEFWRTKSKVVSFFKRNPLFRVGAYV